MMLEMAGGIGYGIRSITGLAAIILMVIHAVWATIVLVSKDEKAITRFHCFIVILWAIWLIPYFTGLFASMR
jgi:uncharacterized repeat protein (TIGR03987 family)